MPRTNKPLAHREEHVRIIRSTADASLDYWLPSERARQLLSEGKLCQIMVYANRWDYAHLNETRSESKLS